MESPLFLGRDLLHKDEAVWIFFGLKDGIGRFIRFVKYPYWCSESCIPAQLIVEEKPPVEVVEEVKLFALGKVIYEQRKTPSGKRTKIVRVPVETNDDSRRIPEQRIYADGTRVITGSEPGPAVSPGAVESPQRRRGRPRKLSSTGPELPLVTAGSESIPGPDKVTAKKRKSKKVTK